MILFEFFEKKMFFSCFDVFYVIFWDLNVVNNFIVTNSIWKQ